ncbi:unnamed protein product [Didymodactylos carnosus]|uniref:Uncharacterized protein n=1 Tax=Didymodactylos carnosus TaxID=1234261 RepID=A0A813Y7I0_9BILA|nr:unnamed protein product [Didymodactylos carnosus]CAF3666794.1 unnamed protein product [Didymodactylos carnosus]
MGTATPVDERAIGNFSNHQTVWLDADIGDPKNHIEFKNLFHKLIQPLETILPTKDHPQYNETEIDIPIMEDEKYITQLKQSVYNLILFKDSEDCFKFIETNPNKKIFLITSGSLGSSIVPRIAHFPQIEGVFIFCFNQDRHYKWAVDFCEIILSDLLIHHDDLLFHLTKNVGKCLESKGDTHIQNNETFKAQNCFAWTKKLYGRAQEFAQVNMYKDISNIDKKIEMAETSQSSSSSP